MNELENFIQHLIFYFKGFSYVGVIILLSLEFIPAELVLPLIGYWVTEGDMIFGLAVLAGVIGGVTGPLSLYCLGRYGGRPLIERYGKYFLIKEKDLVRADVFFEKYGPGVAFFGRFIPGLRTLISIPCGIVRMNVFTFMLYTALAMLPITILYIYLGMKLGQNWEKVGPLIKSFSLPIAGVIIVIALLYVILKRK